MNSNSIKLAIVIPAFKGIFLRQSLESLAAQTNKQFNVYIGDDHSPEGLLKIVDQFYSRLDIRYTRFQNNIGAKNLVVQWNRCVALTQSEPWIWLFSDDDVADSGCVDAFYQTILIQKQHFDVYRFNVRVINDKGEITYEPNESPEIESAFDLAYNIMMGERSHSMPDHIFSKNKFKEVGGFVKTDYAQAADWATSILFAGDKGLYTINGPRVNWRLGDTNITGNAKKETGKKIIGHLQFLKWVKTYFSYLRKENVQDFRKIEAACDKNLETLVKYHYKKLPIAVIKDLYHYYTYISHVPKKAKKKVFLLYMSLFLHYFRRFFFPIYFKYKIYLKNFIKKLIGYKSRTPPV